MSRIVEPVVCCLGQSAGGDPTQFVMERLAREAGLDWRFITAEVSADQINIAVAGARAMNFDGIGFLQPLPAAPRPPLDSFGGSVLCSGRITAARRDGLSWLAEDLTGSAAAAVLRENVRDLTSSSVVVYGNRALECLLRLADPSIAERLVAVVDGLPDSPPDAPPPQNVVSRHDLAGGETQIAALLLASPLSSLDVSLLNQCHFAADAVVFAIDVAGEPQPIDGDSLPQLRRIDSQAMAVASLAAKFHFWTGRRANPESVRDCLDEFASW